MGVPSPGATARSLRRGPRRRGGASDLLLECYTDATDQVLEVTGAKEFHAVVLAIAQLVADRTGDTPGDADRIPERLFYERYEQFLCSYDRTTTALEEPWPLDQRLQDIRDEYGPMSAAAKVLEARIVATAANPAQLDGWRRLEARSSASEGTTASSRVGAGSMRAGDVKAATEVSVRILAEAVERVEDAQRLLRRVARDAAAQSVEVQP